MSDGFITDVFTFVHASDSPMHAVGTVKRSGENEYMYIRNGATVTGTANYPAMEIGATGSFLVTADVTNTTTHVCRGIYMATMATNEYGWIQTKGYYHSANITAAVATIGYPLKVVTDGYFDLCDAAGDVQCGWAAEITTAAVTDGTLSIYLNCPSMGYGGTT